MATILRELAAGATETALPGNTRPAGFKGQGERVGGPLEVSWFVEFFDADGNAQLSGQAIVQWYEVTAIGGLVATTPAGAPATVDALEINTTNVSAGAWPWPRVTAQNEPTGTGKTITVSVGGAADGVYSIAVVGEEEPYEFTASGVSVSEIVDGLALLFDGHPTLTVNVSNDSLAITGAVGEELELVLDSPGDLLTQTIDSEGTAPAATMRIYATMSPARLPGPQGAQGPVGPAGPAATITYPIPQTCDLSNIATTDAFVAIPTVGTLEQVLIWATGSQASPITCQIDPNNAGEIITIIGPIIDLGWASSAGPQIAIGSSPQFIQLRFSASDIPQVNIQLIFTPG